MAHRGSRRHPRPSCSRLSRSLVGVLEGQAEAGREPPPTVLLPAPINPTRTIDRRPTRWRITSSGFCTKSAQLPFAPTRKVSLAGRKGIRCSGVRVRSGSADPVRPPIPALLRIDYDAQGRAPKRA